MKRLLLALAFVTSGSTAASAKSLTLDEAKRFYADLFAAEVSAPDAFPVVRQLPPDHPLSILTRDHKRLLMFFLTNYSDLDYESLRKHASSSAEASTYLLTALGNSERFASVLLPIVAAALREHGDSIQGVSPLAGRSVMLSELVRVAIRFFYVDGITPQGSFRARICVGINGLVDQPFPRDAILEALAYSAIMRDVQDGEHRVMPDFTRTLRQLGQLSLSSNRDSAVSRAQGAMWLAMSDSQALRDILQLEVARTSKILGVSVRP